MFRGLRKIRVKIKGESGFVSLLEMVNILQEFKETKLIFTSGVLRYLTVPAMFVLKI
jgi:hypothetical protein